VYHQGAVAVKHQHRPCQLQQPLDSLQHVSRCTCTTNPEYSWCVLTVH
jgi:hypothetical protein